MMCRYFGNDETHGNNLEVMEHIRVAGINLKCDKYIVKTEYCSSLVTCTILGGVLPIQRKQMPRSRHNDHQQATAIELILGYGDLFV